jgi:flagellar secretion chaperone FliS
MYVLWTISIGQRQNLSTVNIFSFGFTKFTFEFGSPIRDMKFAMTDPQILDRAHRDYLQSRILTAHPTEIVEMLYQLAIDSLNEAIGHLKTGDHFARARAITKAEEAVHELVVSLDHSVNAPLTKNLAGLYQFVLTQMVTGNSRKSEREFREALSILTTLAAAWSEVRRQVCAQVHNAEDVAAEAPQRTDFFSPYGQAMPEAYSRDWSA